MDVSYLSLPRRVGRGDRGCLVSNRYSFDSACSTVTDIPLQPDLLLGEKEIIKTPIDYETVSRVGK